MISLPSAEEALPLALQFKLLQSEKTPTALQTSLQSKSIQSILAHALSSVPYYQQHPKIRSMNGNIEWNKFPILTRKELQANEELLISKNPPKNHGKHFDFRSSGSTGRPVHTWTTEYAQFFWRAFTMRDHLWAKRDLTASLAAIKFLADGKALYPGQTSNNWGLSTAILGYSAPAMLLNSSEPVERQYQWLVEHQAKYLVTYPSTLQELAKIQIREQKLNSLHNISTLGETLPPFVRTLVMEAFNCKIHDIYSSQEIGYIALQCPLYDHYHIQLENCMVEILDDNNQPCTPGQVGRVIVTSLQNYLMPLIRYEIGDYAIPGKKCDCGINLPVLERIIGRSRNLVSYPNGDKSWPAYNPMALMNLFPLARFQIEQLSVEELRLNIEAPDTPTSEQCLQAEEIIQKAIGYPFKVTVHLVNNVPRAPSGKFEEFVSRI